jgi:dynein heavy chain
MGNWLQVLEKHIEKLRPSGFHDDFRIMYTAKPSTNIPAGLLQNSIKVTSEPTRGTKANVMHALDLFNDDTMEQWPKDREFRALFSHLCIFHTIMLERRKCRP